jgi:hypothetical protein
MKKTMIVKLAAFEILCVVLAVLFAPLAVLFAKWDKEQTSFTGGAPFNGPLTIRGDLPWWLSWFGTFDERLPGGMYESDVVENYRRFGPYLCSVLWLWRNRMFGLTKWLFSRPTDFDEKLEYVREEIGPFVYGYGWKRYRATPDAHWIEGPFIAIPSVTIRLKRNG